MYIYIYIYIYKVKCLNTRTNLGIVFKNNLNLTQNLLAKKKTTKHLKIKKGKIDGVNYIKIKLYYVVETTINSQKTV